jgi:hypothetical protein
MMVKSGQELDFSILLWISKVFLGFQKSSLQGFHKSSLHGFQNHSLLSILLWISKVSWDFKVFFVQISKSSKLHTGECINAWSPGSFYQTDFISLNQFII